MSNENLPRVTPAQIAALMSRVLYSLETRPLGSTSTLVHAFLDGTFYLASGHSACVSPEAFNAERGLEIAKENAMKAAEDALWKYEGYALMKRLQEPTVLTLKADFSDEDLAKFRAYWEAVQAKGGDMALLGEDGPLQAVGV